VKLAGKSEKLIYNSMRKTVRTAIRKRSACRSRQQNNSRLCQILKESAGPRQPGWQRRRGRDVVPGQDSKQLEFADGNCCLVIIAAVKKGELEKAEVARLVDACASMRA